MVCLLPGAADHRRAGLGIGARRQRARGAVVLDVVVGRVVAPRQKEGGIRRAVVGVVPGDIHQVIVVVDPDIVPGVGLVAVGAGHNPAGDLRPVAQQFKGVGVALADRFALHQGAVGVVGIRVVVGVAARRGKVILRPLAQRLLEIAQHPHCVAAGLLFGLRDDAVDLVEHRLLLLIGQVEIAEAEGHLIISALVVVIDKFCVIAQKALGVVPARLVHRLAAQLDELLLVADRLVEGDGQALLSLGDRLADLAVKLALIARAAEDIAGHALLGHRLNAHRVACQRRRCEGQRDRRHRGRRS